MITKYYEITTVSIVDISCDDNIESLYKSNSQSQKQTMQH